MSRVIIVLLVIGALLSVSLIFIPFTRKFRDASVWLRTSVFVAGLFVTTWAVLGLFPQFHTSAVPRSVVSDIREHVGALGIGLLIAVGSSPEFRTRAAQRRSKA